MDNPKTGSYPPTIGLFQVVSCRFWIFGRFHFFIRGFTHLVMPTLSILSPLGDYVGLFGFRVDPRARGGLGISLCPGSLRDRLRGRRHTPNPLPPSVRLGWGVTDLVCPDRCFCRDFAAVWLVPILIYCPTYLPA